MTLALLIDIAGWVGALAVVAAYGLVSAGRADPQGTGYQLANLAGAGVLMANGLWYGALPSVAVNLFWIGIAAVALWRARRPGAEGRR
jgi:hypothetical protein